MTKKKKMETLFLKMTPNGLKKFSYLSHMLFVTWFALYYTNQIIQMQNFSIVLVFLHNYLNTTIHCNYKFLNKKLLVLHRRYFLYCIYFKGFKQREKTESHGGSVLLLYYTLHCLLTHTHKHTHTYTYIYVHDWFSLNLLICIGVLPLV